MRPSATVNEAWSRLAPVEAEWDWEAARIGGKLYRFGYCRNEVLVVVLTLHEATLNRSAPGH